ncbi:DNA adenine methylase [Vibrio fluvialis]|uniref:DNA adenine methylase n=1 Tax=Vibrio fluvialis TaxID=676 RepID=UPI0023809454|nr:DNA adenine methylase [Vibrio fluvialis]EKO3482270.1 DNA adenine methylase [Vibrio fluvialis]WDY55517.1 DNA adenine methylase [Vibrio fluvialis]
MGSLYTPVLRYHGGKFRLAKWIMSHFPSHRCYVEPFSGAASVLLQKERVHGEVYNDLDSDIFNLFNVLRNEEQAHRLIELCHLTPYSRDEFKLAYQKSNDPIERARRTIVRSAMGFGSGAATFHPTGFRCEAKRQHRTSAHVWSSYPDVLKFVCERLQGVNIENRPANDCIRYHDGEETLFYVDPPYMLETRKLNSAKSVYQHEMTEADHESLLQCLMSLKGKVVLSGYDSDLYNDYLSSWRKETKSARISAGKGTGIRQECLWVSPNCEFSGEVAHG